MCLTVIRLIDETGREVCVRAVAGSGGYAMALESELNWRIKNCGPGGRWE